jgi:hypothetical protein
MRTNLNACIANAVWLKSNYPGERWLLLVRCVGSARPGVPVRQRFIDFQHGEKGGEHGVHGESFMLWRNHRPIGDWADSY